ncbi:glycosyltransferase family 4 protein [Salipiger sp.]|uniref:glycosyltransferase family 4 protein n=1 Tax=Salipiger sp. TaxID=2078585 RepID=UPI003A982FE9
MTERLRIAMLYDVPDWTFHSVARNVARVCEGCDVALFGRSDWFARREVVRRITETADVIVFLWRFDLLAFFDCLDARGWARMSAPERPALVTVVYDHLYGDRAALEAVGDPFVLSDLVCTCSPRLSRAYDGSPDLPAIHATLPDGVDLSLFTPGPARVPDGALQVGWVGNSRWGSTMAEDLKGRNTVFEPAMRMLQAAGHAVGARVADAAETRVPFAEMPEFYRSLDVLICTSAIEGTPNPVLEAMACGIPVISTDVGIVPEVFGPLQSGFILEQRSPAALAGALRRLLRTPEILGDLRQENLARRAALDWSARAPLWDGVFHAALAARRTGSAGAAIAAHRSRARSRIERVRRLVATNGWAYAAYETMLRRCPGAVRRMKRLLAGGMP